MISKEIALMYSGGLNTTYVALRLAKEFSKVHLLTFCNGFCVRVDASRKHVVMLQDRFGKDRFKHHIILIGDIFSFLRKGLLKDILKYRSPLLFDLYCRLSMEVATIFYCLEQGVKYATDGVDPFTQGEIFLQQEEYLKVAREFFLQYGIEYIHPYSNTESRKEILNNLSAAGIKTGVRLFEDIRITSQLFTQPFCLWAPVAFFFTSPLRNLAFVRFFSLSTEDAISFRMKKEKLAKDYIDYLKSSSLASSIYPCKKHNLIKLFKCK